MTVPDAVDPRVLDVTRLPVRDPWLAIEVRDEVDSTNAVLVAAMLWVLPQISALSSERPPTAA